MGYGIMGRTDRNTLFHHSHPLQFSDGGASVMAPTMACGDTEQTLDDSNADFECSLYRCGDLSHTACRVWQRKNWMAVGDMDFVLCKGLEWLN